MFVSEHKNKGDVGSSGFKVGHGANNGTLILIFSIAIYSHDYFVCSSPDQ